MIERASVVLAVVDWGSVPDWLAGLGAILALIFAFFAVMAGHKTVVQQGLQLRTMQDDRIRSQANKVAAWILEPSGDRTCRIQNGSDLPIFTTHVLLRYWPTEKPGSAGPKRWWRRISVWTLPPGCLDLDIHSEENPIAPGIWSGSLQAAIIFSDANGIHWKRDIDGRLSVIKDDVMQLIFDSSVGEWSESECVQELDTHLRGHDIH